MPFPTVITDYYLNKKDSSYIYLSGKKYPLRQLQEDNPNFSQKDFDRLHADVLNICKEEEKSNRAYGDRATVSYSDFDNSVWLQTESAEDEFFGKLEKAEKSKKLCDAINSVLTETEKRRLLLHVWGRKTATEIAGAENVSQQCVSKSILAAKTKLRKELKKKI